MVIGLPLSILEQDRRLQRRRNIGIFLGVLVMIVVMVNVNAYIAPLHVSGSSRQSRLSGGKWGMPKKLDDLVPESIDHVPYARHKFLGIFWYARVVQQNRPCSGTIRMEWTIDLLLRYQAGIIWADRSAVGSGREYQ